MFYVIFINGIRIGLDCGFWAPQLQWLYGAHNFTSFHKMRKKNAGKARLCSKVAKRYNVKLADKNDTVTVLAKSQ